VSQVLVAHTHNPSYSGGRDQEERSSQQTQKIVCENLSQKNKHYKKELEEWLKAQALISDPSTKNKNIV
jgi:hypothetical protein